MDKEIYCLYFLCLVQLSYKHRSIGSSLAVYAQSHKKNYIDFEFENSLVLKDHFKDKEAHFLKYYFQVFR
jgi:hypothetical protein